MNNISGEGEFANGREIFRVVLFAVGVVGVGLVSLSKGNGLKEETDDVVMVQL